MTQSSTPQGAVCKHCGRPIKSGEYCRRHRNAEPASTGGPPHDSGCIFLSSRGIENCNCRAARSSGPSAPQSAELTVEDDVRPPTPEEQQRTRELQKLWPAAAPQPVAGEGPQQWRQLPVGYWFFLDSPVCTNRYSVQERTDSGCILVCSTQWHHDGAKTDMQRIADLHNSRLAEGTPKLEEAARRCVELAERKFDEWMREDGPSLPTLDVSSSDFTAILRPFITPACSPQSFDDGLETAAQLIERVCQGCDCKHSEAYAKLIRARKGKPATPASTGETNGLESRVEYTNRFGVMAPDYDELKKSLAPSSVLQASHRATFLDEDKSLRPTSKGFVGVPPRHCAGEGCEDCRTYGSAPDGYHNFGVLSDLSK